MANASLQQTSVQPASPDAVSDAALADSGRRVFEVEREGLVAVEQRIDGQFSAACRTLLACQGRVVCIGMGKSGHIARKIAATFASTGTPAFYVHPGEAGHGDLGMITDRDVVLALSNSGESDEILTLLPVLKRQGNRLIHKRPLQMMLFRPRNFNLISDSQIQSQLGRNLPVILQKERPIFVINNYFY